MYTAKELLGKVVTIRTTTGQEIVGTLLGIDSDHNAVTVRKPKLISVAMENNQQSVFMMPFYLTATAQDETLSCDSFLSVTETMESTAQEYLSLVQEETVDVEAEATED